MKKGLFFSLDAVFAVIVALVIIFGIFYQLSKSQQDLFPSLYLSKVSSDTLVILNKNKILETLNSTTIQDSLNDILPDNLGYELNITVFDCSDQNCNSFSVVSSKNVYLLNSTLPESDFVNSKRSFLTFQNNRIQHYSISNLEVWLK